MAARSRFSTSTVSVQHRNFGRVQIQRYVAAGAAAGKICTGRHAGDGALRGSDRSSRLVTGHDGSSRRGLHEGRRRQPPIVSASFAFRA
jgi:hypothetical protein